MDRKGGLQMGWMFDAAFHPIYEYPSANVSHQTVIDVEEGEARSGADERRGGDAAEANWGPMAMMVMVVTKRSSWDNRWRQGSKDLVSRVPGRGGPGLPRSTDGCTVALPSTYLSLERLPPSSNNSTTCLPTE